MKLSDLYGSSCQKSSPPPRACRLFGANGDDRTNCPYLVPELVTPRKLHHTHTVYTWTSDLVGAYTAYIHRIPTYYTAYLSAAMNSLIDQ